MCLITAAIVNVTHGLQSSEKLRSINATVSAACKRRVQEMANQSLPKEKVRRLIQFDQPPAEDNQ